MSRYLPLEYDVRGRTAAVVGADALVLSKIERLRRAGADVIVYACDGDVDPHIAVLAEAGEIQLARGAPEGDALEPACVVFVSPAFEDRVAGMWQSARAHGRLWCTLDRPEQSTFVNPATFDAGGIGVRLVSGGASPALLRRLREDLERLLSDPRLERFVSALAARRAALPRGERAHKMREAVRGFRLEGRLELPAWFESGAE